MAARDRYAGDRETRTLYLGTAAILYASSPAPNRRRPSFKQLWLRALSGTIGRLASERETQADLTLALHACQASRIAPGSATSPSADR
jgi:hypothetical protein